MPTTGVIFAGGLFATDVSGDGRTIVGVAPDPRGVRNAAIWQRATSALGVRDGIRNWLLTAA